MAEITSSAFNPEDFQRLLTPTNPPQATPQDSGQFIPASSTSQPTPVQIAEDMEVPLEPEIVEEPAVVDTPTPEVFALPEDDIPLDPGSDNSDENLQLLASLDREKLQQLLSLVENATPPPPPAPPVEEVPSEEAADEPLVVTPMRGWRGMLARWGLPVSPTQDEIEDSIWERELRTPLPHTPVLVGSTSFKGGCGKTTAASMIATMFALYNPDKKVILVDLDPTGNAAARAKDQQVADVQSYVDAIRNSTFAQGVDPAAFVTSTVAGVDILGARMDVSVPSLQEDEVQLVLQSVAQFYDFVIVDMQYFTDKDPSYSRVLDMLDAVVFLYEAKPDAVSSLSFMDTLLQNRPKLNHKKVVVFNRTKPETQHERFTLQEVASDLIEQDAEVVELPYVDALYWGGPLDAEDIADQKLRPFTQLAATLMFLLRQDDGL